MASVESVESEFEDLMRSREDLTVHPLHPRLKDPCRRLLRQ